MNSRIILYMLFYFLLLQQMVHSQTSTVSPYSMFGLGDVEWSGSGKSRLMGGTGIAFKSEGYLNNLNPASYSALDSNSFIFEAGLESSVSYFKSYDITQRSSTTNFNYLGFGFRATRWWKTSLGLKPFSHIGYNINAEQYIEGTTSTYFTQFSGSGDITQLYWGNSFGITRNLSLGISASYLFGPITQEERVLLSISNNEEVISRKKHVSGFYYDLGLQYTLPLSKFNYTLGLIYGPGKTLKTTHTISQYNTIDTLKFDQAHGGIDYGLPQKFGAGMAIENNKKSFLAGIDYQFEKWDDVAIEQVGIDLKNSQRLSLAMQLQPNARSRYNYFNRVQYTLGAYYVRSNVQHKGISIDEKAITLGFGFPIKEKSVIYLGLETGRRGQLLNGLIQEDFYNVNLTFSLKDTWFSKTRYK